MCSFTKFYLTKYHELWTYRVDFFIQQSTIGFNEGKDKDFIVNNELRKKLTDINKMMLAFGVVARDVLKKFKLAVNSTQPQIPGKINCPFTPISLSFRSFIHSLIDDVQEQIKKDSTYLVDEYIWLDYGYEIMMLTDAPDLLELDPITKLQID